MSIASGTGSPVVHAPVAAELGGPVVAGLSPLDDARAVDVARNFMVTFDRPVSLGQGTVTLKKASGDGTVEVWDVATEAGTLPGQVGVFDTVMTLCPTDSLAGGLEYYIVWDAGIVKDGDGNPVAAQASPTAWSFTTVAKTAERKKSR